MLSSPYGVWVATRDDGSERDEWTLLSPYGVWVATSCSEVQASSLDCYCPLTGCGLRLDDIDWFVNDFALLSPYGVWVATSSPRCYPGSLSRYCPLTGCGLRPLKQNLSCIAQFVIVPLRGVGCDCPLIASIAFIFSVIVPLRGVGCDVGGPSKIIN